MVVSVRKSEIYCSVCAAGYQQPKRHFTIITEILQTSPLIALSRKMDLSGKHKPKYLSFMALRLNISFIRQGFNKVIFQKHLFIYKRTHLINHDLLFSLGIYLNLDPTSLRKYSEGNASHKSIGEWKILPSSYFQTLLQMGKI